MELGQIVKDKVTGFSGLVTARAYYLTGCTQYLITPTDLDRDGNIREGEWLDDSRVEIVEELKGGPQRDTPSN